MSRQAQIITAVLCLWMLTIFVTSCFFIDRDAFIHTISRLLPAGAFQEKWATLWLVAGIFIVKGYHVTEYAVLYCLLDVATRALPPGNGLRHPAIRFALCLLFAASDEWHQTFVPGRGGTIVDVGIDSIGITIAAVSLSAIRRRQERRAAQRQLL